MRLGVVNFLNALPLWEPLKELAHIELVPAMPSELAAMLRAGAIDAGLLPIIEYFRNPRVRFLAGPCVAADGPVESVLLFHRKALNEVKTLRLDANSRTSNALCQVLMAGPWGAKPEIHLPSERLTSADGFDEDACVSIGDPAMRMVADAKAAGLMVSDLAQAWQEYAGLPFVFAAWLVREGVELEQQVLADALSEGEKRVEQYAQEHAQKMRLPQAELERYLKSVIRYRWGQDLREAIGEFGKQASALGLCEKRPLQAWGE